MAFPGAKVHRVNRRKLGRGQYPASLGTTVVLTDAVAVLTMTFARPVVVTGNIPVTVAGGPTFVSQTVVSGTVVTQTWSATLVGHLVTFPSNAANVTTQQGGGVAGTSVTF
jgi:hypothetical protein